MSGGKTIEVGYIYLHVYLAIVTITQVGVWLHYYYYYYRENKQSYVDNIISFFQYFKIDFKAIKMSL